MRALIEAAAASSTISTYGIEMLACGWMVEFAESSNTRLERCVAFWFMDRLESIRRGRRTTWLGHENASDIECSRSRDSIHHDGTLVVSHSTGDAVDRVIDSDTKQVGVGLRSLIA